MGLRAHRDKAAEVPAEEQGRGKVRAPVKVKGKAKAVAGSNINLKKYRR